MPFTNSQILNDIVSAASCVGTPFNLNGDSLRDVQDYLQSHPRQDKEDLSGDELDRRRFFTDLTEAHAQVRVPSSFIKELSELLS